jgi:hypothetical protein
MKRIVLPIVVVVVIVVVAVVMMRKGPAGTPGAVVNQGQVGGVGGQGGGGQMSQFREAHKYTFMLTRMASNIGRLDVETDAPLSAEQAKSILAVLTPLKTKPTLTQDEAKDIMMKLKATLTAKQLTEIGKMKQPDHRFRSANQGGGSGGPGSGPGGTPRADRPRFDPSAMKDFNPFNPPKDSPMAGRSSKRLNALFTALEAKAKGG